VIAEGQVLDGTYRLLRLVGEGGMGVVYEATHARLAGRYAIKVLLQNLADDGAALTQFDREARITSSLQHPNIVQVIDHNTTADGTSYLVMEFLAGESLAHRLARTGRLGLDAVVDIVDQLAAGLAAAHAHGIVHRDLKPDNIFLVSVEGRPTELVKILDFGISRSGSGIHAVDRELCGTPQYMSPEQVEGGSQIASAADQFALAVIAYELLTGRNPFAGDGLADTFAKVAAQDPPPTGVSPAVDAVLARGYAKSRWRRFPSVIDLAAALRAAAGDTRRPLATPVYPAGEILAPGEMNLEPRRRGGGWAIGVGLLASVAAVLYFGDAESRMSFSRPAAAEPSSPPPPPAPETAGPDRPDAGLPGETPPAEVAATPEALSAPEATPHRRAAARKNARPPRTRSMVGNALPPDEDDTMPPTLP
jgi:serine/threonine protein kinase